MPILAIDHVQLAMPAGGEPLARRFYSELLGICWFEDGPLKVHLGVETDFRPAGKAHPALLTA